MFWSSCLTLLLLQGVSASPAPRINRRTKISDNVLTLKRTGVKAGSSRALMSELAQSETTPLIAVESGSGYAVDVELGDDTFPLIFDTGSSDLWVATNDFQCLNAKGKKVPTSKCDFGKLWNGKYEGGQIPRENFNIQYGDGEALAGTLGYEDVTVAGVTVNKQEIAAVTEGYWVGDGVTSGILGMAYSSLTSAYPGNNPSKDNPKTNNIHYKNWLANAIDMKKIDSLFSIAIERGSNTQGGQVALGGLPNVNFQHDFATTPLLIRALSDRHPIGSKNYTYYTIQPDAVVVGGQSANIDFPVIVDSGTSLVYLPPQLARAINKAFDPPSQKIQGIWANHCNAKPPNVAITIGGKSFQISSAELLIQDGANMDPNTACISGIQASAAGPYILGDVFLKNVIAVFDIGESEMRFAPHVTY